jgi:hypothetical protein
MEKAEDTIKEQNKDCDDAKISRSKIVRKREVV